MLNCTPQERAVLSWFVAVFLIGTMLHYTFKKYPALYDIVNIMESDRLYHKIDINTASLEELIDIPYIGTYTAGNIIRYRQEHGPFTDIRQIKLVKGIKEKNYKKFARHIRCARQDKPVAVSPGEILHLLSGGRMAP